jgi:S-formylglutathione hydrolase FrmB
MLDCFEIEDTALPMKRVCSLLIVLLLAICSGAFARKTELHKGMNTITLPESRNGSSPAVAVDIYIPSSDKITGDVLVLPGWKYSRTRWHKETEITRYADTFGFRLVFPDMSVSSYESEYYPETTMKWARTPGGEWVRSVLLAGLSSEFGIFEKGGNNFLLGLSTGGRGVLLVALQNPGLFSGGATLSGDCDQSLMPGDNLMRALYGNYKEHTSRWETVDNPIHDILKGKWTIPLYIGHGKKDAVSPFDQSLLLYQTIRIKNPKLQCEFNAPDRAGHNFEYWKSEIPPVMKFFRDIAE